jgi:ATP-binding cassette subfamily B protein
MVAVIERGRAALAGLRLVDAPVERPEGPCGTVLPAGSGPRLELRHLHFAYPDDPHRPVLRDVSATVEAGAFVGLFGRTGSGKSTLLRVLARLYNPPNGAVLVDGHDLNSLDLDAWRRQLAVVPQRPFLFSDSVAANVALAVADDDRVRQVVRWPWTRTSRCCRTGWPRWWGARDHVSGGQRQRPALACGLPRADLLLLDDVLAAVDHATESSY